MGSYYTHPNYSGHRGTLGRHSSSGKNGFNNWHGTKVGLHERSGVTGWTVHDLRRSTATGMAELGIQPHIIEAVLNHVSGHKPGVAGIYNRSTYEREIRNALATWADHIISITTGAEPKVIPMRSNSIPA